MVLGVERRTRIGLEQTSFWTTVMQIVLQTTAIVVLASCLLVCQKLFMYRLLTLKQTLTRSHDQYAAWLGIGNAIMTLFKQRSTHSGVSSVLMITVYLAASAALKITTPALFQFALHTTTINTPSTATSIYPYPFPDTPLRKLLRPELMQLIQLEQDPSGNGSSFSTLLSSVGLQGNVIYDVLQPVANATGQVEVNTCTVSVQCHSIDHKMMREDSSGLFDTVLLPINIFSVNNDEGVSINGFVDKQSRGGDSFYRLSTVLPILSFLNITDSRGNHSKRFPLQSLFFAEYDQSISGKKPLVSLSGQPDDPDLMMGQVYSAEFALCSLEYTMSKGRVYSNSRTLVGVPERKVTSEWTEHPVKNWSTWTRTPLLEVGRNSFRDQDAMVPLFTCNRGNNTIMDWHIFREPLSFFEMYLLQRLGLIPTPPIPDTDGISEMPQFPSLQLHDFENALEDFIALYLFSGQLAVANDTANDAETSNQISVAVPTNVLESQLKLSKLPVYVGLTATLLMFAVVLWTALTTPVYQSRIDNLGLLQLLWLSNVDLGVVSRPTERKLRSAGLSRRLRLKDGLASLPARGASNFESGYHTD
ncbi:hypothetical protein DL96DRAFT_1646400 [Flagelloscypha sp. PMI_526]|nr:hypothetical protein DL96DRAFT_1646400 [Flagelloscypha sp. PMI_526]